MKKQLLHIELRDAGKAYREGRLSIDDYVDKLVPFFIDHFHNMGLSEDAFRSWAFDPDPKLAARVRKELAKPEISDGWSQVHRYMTEHAGRSRAFVPLGSRSRKTASGKIVPTFSWLVQKYYQRKGLVSTTKAAGSLSEPIFYTPPPRAYQKDYSRWV